MSGADFIREEGEWKVAHRHADTLAQSENPQET
jgi:hypothetical protein